MRQQTRTIVMAAALLAGLAGFTIGWFGPTQYEAESVLFVRRISVDEPTPQELRDLIDEIEVAALLPFISQKIDDEQGIVRDTDYTLDISVAEGTDGVVQFRARSTGPTAADYVAGRAPALVVELFTDQDINRSLLSLDAAQQRIDASIESGSSAGEGVSPLASSAAASRIDLAAARSARDAFDAGGLTTNLESATPIPSWGDALWSALVGAVGAALMASAVFGGADWYRTQNSNGRGSQ